MARRGELLALLFLLVLAVIWSAIAPRDRLVWWMESAPLFLALPVLFGTWARFPLTRLSYYLVFFYALVLLVGAHYTYARVPAGNWVRQALDLGRNDYDRFAHVLQGLVPAILAREVLVRLNVIRPGRWLFFLVSCVCLAISALYELVEWQSAVWGGNATLAFLGAQGDVWDAQADMAMALLGAIVGQLCLSTVHDRQIAGVRAAVDRET